MKVYESVFFYAALIVMVFMFGNDLGFIHEEDYNPYYYTMLIMINLFGAILDCVLWWVKEIHKELKEVVK